MRQVPTSISITAFEVASLKPSLTLDQHLSLFKVAYLSDFGIELSGLLPFGNIFLYPCCHQATNFVTQLTHRSKDRGARFPLISTT